MKTRLYLTNEAPCYNKMARGKCDKEPQGFIHKKEDSTITKVQTRMKERKNGEKPNQSHEEKKFMLFNDFQKLAQKQNQI